MEEKDLLCCPFCGGEAGIEHVHYEYKNAPDLDAYVLRHGCEIIGNVDFKNEQEAVEAWNRRAAVFERGKPGKFYRDGERMADEAHG